MNKKIALPFYIMVGIFLAGCAKEPPKCSDEKTLSLVREIFADKAGENTPRGFVIENIKFDHPLATGYDEKIKKYSCETKLIAADAYHVPISYSSQLNDDGQQVVSVGGISDMDSWRVLYSISKKFMQAEAKKAEAAKQSALDAIAGTWEGKGDGSEIEMKIKQESSNINVSLGVGAPGCGGEIEGVGSFSENILTLTRKEDDQTCTLTVTFAGETATVKEDSCSFYHGASCSFSGQLTRQK